MAPAGADSRRLATFNQVLARLQDLPNYTWALDVDPIHSVSYHPARHPDTYLRKC
jgi:hypothetical protein